MKEYEFKCEKCNAVWYATGNDIRENKKLKREMNFAKFHKAFSLHTNKTHRRMAEQIAQMKVAYVDPERCPVCGSRKIKKV